MGLSSAIGRGSHVKRFALTETKKSAFQRVLHRAPLVKNKNSLLEKFSPSNTALSLERTNKAAAKNKGKFSVSLIMVSLV